MFRKYIALLLMLTAFTGLIFYAISTEIKSDEEITILLDWTPNTNHTGLFVAEKLGFFEKEGLKVKIKQPPQGDAATIVAAGGAEFCVDFQDFLAPALSMEKPLNLTAVAAIFQHNNSGIISKNENKILALNDMCGKKYATFNNDIEKAVLKYCVEKCGGNFSSIELVCCGTENICLALGSNVDTAWVYDNIQRVETKLCGVETNFFLFREIDEVFDYYTPIILANRNYMNQNRETVKKAVRAISRGYSFAAENPEKAAEILLEIHPDLDRKFIIESQKESSRQYKADSGVWGYIDEKRWCGFYDWLYENGILKRKISADAFTNEFLVN